MDSFIPILGTLIGILLPIILFLLLKTAQKKKFESLPTQSSPAKIIQKDIYMVRINGKSAARREVFYITFEFPKSEKLTFRVNHNIFCSLSEGMDGLLSFKHSDTNNYFISFE